MALLVSAFVPMSTITKFTSTSKSTFTSISTNRVPSATRVPITHRRTTPLTLSLFPNPSTQPTTLLATATHALTAFIATSTLPKVLLAIAFVAALAVLIKKDLDTPSRPYKGSFDGVGAEYDQWTTEGLVEYYWGEHIHMGYYSKEERKRGYLKKDFKQAKVDFVLQMLYWSDCRVAKRILDVGCGIGGTSRILAKQFPHAEVIGITLSQDQAKRAQKLAEDQGLNNVRFEVMDALNMTFPDNSFDLVWACESGEHMPDKAAYVNEMSRVLAPGGTLAVATWCQRDTPPEFTQEEKDRLQYLYDEWSHPHFISYEEYQRIMEKTGSLEQVVAENWVEQTLPSWRHSNWVGVFDPWQVIFKFNPIIWYRVIREIVCIERFHRAMRDGLMTYGMIKAVKSKVKTLQYSSANASVGTTSNSNTSNTNNNNNTNARAVEQ